MSAKKVTCGIKPTPQAPAAASADQWVASRTRETIKRLTLDLPGACTCVSNQSLSAVSNREPSRFLLYYGEIEMVFKD